VKILPLKTGFGDPYVESGNTALAPTVKVCLSLITVELPAYPSRVQQFISAVAKVDKKNAVF
jgi:hypothetical protein